MKTTATKQKLLALLILALLLSALPAAAWVEELPAAETRYVEAATVDELLKAIAPDTTVTLTGRSYDLTRAQGYGVYGSKYYRWNEIYDDGWELVIEDVQNLTIRAGRSGVELVTVPRYACVLKFEHCGGVTLEGFTAGHTDGPGFCTGAVLNMNDCSDMQVLDCDLYGCGTYGLELTRCRGVRALGSTIRDCSYGALWADNCSDLLVDNCSVHGIEAYEGIFTLSACRSCAILNTLVRSSAASSLVSLRSAKDCYMAGCEISRNRLNGMFSCAPYPLVLEGCAFQDNTCENGWYQEDWLRSERVSAPDGHSYSDDELAALTLTEGAVWNPPETPEIPVEAPEVSEDGMIHVRTVDELLASIAPDTTIFLEDGVYNLSHAQNYGYGSGDYWYWMDCFDGPGLVIRGADNLRITSAGPHRARIVAEPRYCEVLSFENCDGISLSNFTAGHTQDVEDFGCAGGVLNFTDCRDIRVEDCSLYGCGIVGLTFYDCRDAGITHTEIHDCSDGAGFFYGSSDIALSACNIHDIPGAYYQVYDCQNITVDGTVLSEGGSW